MEASPVLSQPAALFLAVVMIEAALVDYFQHRVPNWLTYHLAAAGLAVAAWNWGWTGLGWSLAGLGLGMLPLLLLYCVGWMGAGDVKLFGAAGAWMGPAAIATAFFYGGLAGGAIGLFMMARSGRIQERLFTMWLYARELLSVRDPVILSRLAAERKGRMELIPYGVPLTIGALITMVEAGWLHGLV